MNEKTATIIFILMMTTIVALVTALSMMDKEVNELQKTNVELQNNYTYVVAYCDSVLDGFDKDITIMEQKLLLCGCTID